MNTLFMSSFGTIGRDGKIGTDVRMVVETDVCEFHFFSCDNKGVFTVRSWVGFADYAVRPCSRYCRSFQTGHLAF